MRACVWLKSASMFHKGMAMLQDASTTLGPSGQRLSLAVAPSAMCSRGPVNVQPAIHTPRHNLFGKRSQDLTPTPPSAAKRPCRVASLPNSISEGTKDNAIKRQWRLAEPCAGLPAGTLTEPDDDLLIIGRKAVSKLHGEDCILEEVPQAAKAVDEGDTESDVGSSVALSEGLERLLWSDDEEGCEQVERCHEVDQGAFAESTALVPVPAASESLRSLAPLALDDLRDVRETVLAPVPVLAYGRNRRSGSASKVQAVGAPAPLLALPPAPLTALPPLSVLFEAGLAAFRAANGQAQATPPVPDKTGDSVINGLQDWKQARRSPLAPTRFAVLRGMAEKEAAEEKPKPADGKPKDGEAAPAPAKVIVPSESLGSKDHGTGECKPCAWTVLTVTCVTRMSSRIGDLTALVVVVHNLQFGRSVPEMHCSVGNQPRKKRKTAQKKPAPAKKDADRRSRSAERRRPDAPYEPQNGHDSYRAYYERAYGTPPPNPYYYPPPPHGYPAPVPPYGYPVQSPYAYYAPPPAYGYPPPGPYGYPPPAYGAAYTHPPAPSPGGAYEPPPGAPPRDRSYSRGRGPGAHGEGTKRDLLKPSEQVMQKPTDWLYPARPYPSRVWQWDGAGEAPRQGQDGFRKFVQTALERFRSSSSEEDPMRSSGRSLPLQPYQLRVAFLLHPLSPLTRLLVVHATGSGKTRTVLAAADSFFRSGKATCLFFPEEAVKENFYQAADRGLGRDLPAESVSAWSPPGIAMEWYVKTNTYWEIKKKLLAPAGYNLMREVSDEVRFPKGSATMETMIACVQAPGSVAWAFLLVSLFVSSGTLQEMTSACAVAHKILMWWGRWVPGCPFNVVEPPERFLAFTHVGVV
eukprot:s1826_g6.t2